MAGSRSYKGIFKPQNPKKYRGDVNNIVWRSSWELKMMNALDLNPNVISWASEELVVPYFSPVDNRQHRYFPDFFIEYKKPDGKSHKMLVEVKPEYQTVAPKLAKKMTKRMITELETWEINKAKWAAAQSMCEHVGWEFRVATERDLGIK